MASNKFGWFVRSLRAQAWRDWRGFVRIVSYSTNGRVKTLRISI